MARPPNPLIAVPPLATIEDGNMEYRNDTAYELHPERQLTSDRELHPLKDLICYMREYARERPEVVALTCFGIGFILGWKLKPW